MIDHLAAEPLLVERLKSRLPATVQVMVSEELDGVRDASQFVPAVHVLYGGHRIGKAPYPGCEQRLQRWFCVVAVRNRRSAAERKGEAGRIIASVEAALLGHKLSSEHTPLIGQDAPKPEYGPGVIYYILVYQTSIVVKGEA